MHKKGKSKDFLPQKVCQLLINITRRLDLPVYVHPSIFASPYISITIKARATKVGDHIFIGLPLWVPLSQKL